MDLFGISIGNLIKKSYEGVVTQKVPAAAVNGVSEWSKVNYIIRGPRFIIVLILPLYVF